MTSTTTSSSSIVTRYSLNGRLFFDHNGNGQQDGQEPGISDTNVQLADNSGKIITEDTTDSSGNYKLDDVLPGSYRLLVKADPTYRYMCASVTEATKVSDGYQVALSGPLRMDVGLMEGFLTLPFATGTEYSILEYVDISNTETPMDWMGGNQTYQRGNYKHSGIDYGMAEGTPILAAAPAIVSGSTLNDQNGGNTLWLKHEDGYYTYYAHLKQIVANGRGSQVARGQVIGRSGFSTDGTRHLHFETEEPPSPETLPYEYPIDPYRSLVQPLGSKLSLWTKDNDPKYAMA